MQNKNKGPFQRLFGKATKLTVDLKKKFNKLFYRWSPATKILWNCVMSPLLGYYFTLRAFMTVNVMKVNGHINGKRDSKIGLSCFITRKQSSSKVTTNFIINQLWLKHRIHQVRHAAHPPLTDLLAVDRRESPILAVNATQGNAFSRVKPEWLPHKLLFMLYLKREGNLTTLRRGPLWYLIRSCENRTVLIHFVALLGV